VTIDVYEGTPGSGKTLHATEEGIIAMRRPGGVIANYVVTKPRLRKDGSEKWVYLSAEDMTPEALIEHAERWHPKGKESQGTIIIDECHRVLNSRTTWTGRQKIASRQLELVQFLAEHRHFGYDVILVVQNLQMLDKHARFLAEYRVKHFKANNFWWLAWVPLPIFGRVAYNAQFPSMKGRLNFSLGLLTRGRYDYLAMRQKVAGAFASEEARPRALLGLRPTVVQASDDDPTRMLEEVRQATKAEYERRVFWELRYPKVGALVKDGDE